MNRKPINVFLTEEEKEHIRAGAAIASLPLSTYIRMTALKQPVHPRLDTKTRHVLASLGNNISQIAKIGNTYGTVSKADIDNLRQQAMEIIRLIRQEHK